jgi:aspartyl-tRNA(Asn)/glutamyl-tRNA(Gln) amidotransferase subunit A
MNLSTASLVEILEAIKTGVVTQAQVWQHFDRVTTELDPELQAYNFRTPNKPEATNGPLAGLPIAIKDVYSETGVPTTASSKMLENYIAPYESTATKRLKAAGIISLGKVNHDEFAMGATGENSALRISRNPWDTTRVPGGSSSGSSVAVASGMAPASIATDTGGSIRQPASLTGVVGFKGTYGSVSRYGVIPMASSLDTMGVLSRTVRDAHLVWDAMQGHDPLDATSLDGRIEVSPDIWNRKDLK